MNEGFFLIFKFNLTPITGNKKLIILCLLFKALQNLYNNEQQYKHA